jgi:SAM-dependent methyltransferase
MKPSLVKPKLTAKLNSQSRRDNYEMRVHNWDFSEDQDFSPHDFQVIDEPVGLKGKLRPIVHPLIINLHEPFLRRRIGDLELSADYQMVWGNRGGGTPFLSHKVKRYLGLEGKRILVLGVGFGPELQYWVPHKPAYIAGTEVLNYEKAWATVKQHYRGTDIQFFRTKGSDLSCFEDENFDFATSTAVLEHVQDVPEMMAETARVLRPGGIAALCFGPLWNTFGGDHFSGNEAFENGFNHVFLDEDAYESYLDSVPLREGGMADGRVWIRQKLFSYLKADEYIEIFKQHFSIEFLRVHLSIKALKFRDRYPDRYREMVTKRNLPQKEPLIGAMEVFLKKKG